MDNLTADILIFMGQCGIRYKESELYNVTKYVEKMIADKRLMRFDDEDGIQSVLFFSICNDSEPYLKKGTWEYKYHYDTGSIFYVEKLASRKWTRKLTMMVHDLATQMYPSIQLGKWHRWGRIGDREYTLKVRRRAYV